MGEKQFNLLLQYLHQMILTKILKRPNFDTEFEHKLQFVGCRVLMILR